MTLDHLLDGLLEFATNEQGSKSLTKALKEGGSSLKTQKVISHFGNIEPLALYPERTSARRASAMIVFP